MKSVGTLVLLAFIASSAPAIATKSVAVEGRKACRERLEAQLDRIDARMRKGYSRSEGERLRASQRDLSRQRYECGRAPHAVGNGRQAGKGGFVGGTDPPGLLS